MDTRETLESRIDELFRENEQLRQQVASIIDRSFRTADKMDCLNTENAKLREELEQWRRLAAGIELPEYPITEFKPKDLERENAKLRELVKHLRECTRHNTCAVCEYADDACDFDYDMRELGIIKEA